MAIATPTLLTAGQDLANLSRYTIPASGLLSFVSGRFYVLGTETDMGTGDAMSSYTVGIIGDSAVFSFGSYGNFADDDDIAYWTFAPAANYSNVSLHVHSNAGSQSNLRWGLVEVAYGFNRSAVTKQAQFFTSSASAYVNHNLSSAPDSDSVTIVFAVNSTDNVAHSPFNYTELGEGGTGGGGSDGGNSSIGYASPAVSNSSTALASGTGDFGAWVLEIDANAGAASDDALVRFGSMDYADGSGLVTADFTGGAAATIYDGGYYLRRRRLDDLTAFEEV